MKREGVPRADPSERLLLATCRRRAIELLRRNLTPAGMRAATPLTRARRRGYGAIFGRDDAICALAMALCGDRVLERAAARGVRTLAAHQAENGQIPKFVDLKAREADFWYVGCIDATLWWLIALALLDRWGVAHGLARTHRVAARRALGWLAAQEHPRFRLLQQNEASDWADIMPRSGFVLYSNALWSYTQHLYAMPGAAATRASCNGLFHPFSAGLAEYRRAHLLADYALRGARRRGLYLSFVNFSFFGDEGDVFGNLLAILLGIADPAARERTLRALIAAGVDSPYPVRAVVHPIRPRDTLWRAYMARHRQNFSWQYHNGGIWPLLGGFWVMALVACGRLAAARQALLQLARSCALGRWRFTEWFHGRTLAPAGMPGQSWSAAAYLLAEYAVAKGVNPFGPSNAEV